MLVFGWLFIVIALYGGVNELSWTLWAVLLFGGMGLVGTGMGRPYLRRLTLWQIRHPRQAWWMARTGRKVVARYEESQRPS